MKTSSFIPLRNRIARTARLSVLAALLHLCGAGPQNSAAQTGSGQVPQTSILQDPELTLTLSPPGSVTLSWFADYEVPYQLETTTDLKTYTTIGSLRIGSGGYEGVIRPMGNDSRRFFRVRRMDIVPVTAIFDLTSHVLTINGNDEDNAITVTCDAAGLLLINDGSVVIACEAAASIYNTGVIRIMGKAGGDRIALDETNGPLPKAELYGGPGEDTLIGGSGGDLLIGGTESDSLFGRGGADLLFGGAGLDVLEGGPGIDGIYGEAATDRLIWRPGDDGDTNEGGDGIDFVEVNGGDEGELFTVTANGARVRFDRIGPVPCALDIGSCENLVLYANGGHDTFSATGNLAPLISLTVEGGPGDDTLLGSNGIDTLRGGEGNDFIDGQQGNDRISLEGGNDSVQWDPGDGSDSIDGDDGSDRLIFNGSATAERFDLTTVDSRVRFTRNIASIVLNFAGIETFDLNAGGGADFLTISNLAGSGLARINASLAGGIGSSTGDGQQDVVTIYGTSFADSFGITGDADTGAVEVAGLSALVRITTSEAAHDDLVINGLGDVDTFTTGPGVETLIRVSTND